MDALQDISSSEITDPTLIAATQLTVELDAVLFPINKRSTQKEPQTWFNELRNQNIPNGVLRSLQRFASEQHAPTLRAKKAAACLMWVSGMSMTNIEARVTQFGGLDGAAGPMRFVKSRTCDLLPTVARIAELLHADLALAERLENLLTRLELGIPVTAVALAKLVGDRLSRGDYLRLANVGFINPEAMRTVADDSILNCLDGSKDKLKLVRNAVEKYKPAGPVKMHATPMVPPYESDVPKVLP